MNAKNVVQMRPTGTNQMAEDQLGEDHDFWIRRTASRLVGELPTSHADAMLVMTYMAEFLAHTDNIEVPIHVETARSVLSFDRKDKID